MRSWRIIGGWLIYVTFEMITVIMGYTQVSTSGGSDGNSSSSDGPKIYKAFNTDLLLPQSFNFSEQTYSYATPALATIRMTQKPLLPYQEQQQQQQQSIYYHNESQHKQNLPNKYEQQQKQQPTDFIENLQQQHPKQQQSQPLVFVTPQYETMDPITLNNNGIITKTITNTQEWDNKIKEPPMQQQQQQPVQDLVVAGTGRAAIYGDSGYPFGQLITPLIKTTQQHQPKQQHRVILPSSSSSLTSSLPVIYPTVTKGNIYQKQVQRKEQQPTYTKIYKSTNKATITDRFSPSEAVASNRLKNQRPSHIPIQSTTNKKPQSNFQNNFNGPADDLYSFPPNNINYPSIVSEYETNNSSNTINSYSPPPSGPLHSSENIELMENLQDPKEGYDYKAPAHQYTADGSTLSESNSSPESGPDDGDDNQDDDDHDHDHDQNEEDFFNGMTDDSIGVLPASAIMDKPQLTGHAMEDHPSNNHLSVYDDEKEYPTPPAEWLKQHPESSSEHPSHYYRPAVKHYQQTKTIKTAAPPLYTYNDDNDYHHHHYEPHHHYVEHATPPPPSPPPPEPRVKKYSYFYIGRKLWYIPLYFTVWFTFYVLWLILKSIARHKVNLPNHYVNRRSLSSHNVLYDHDDFINQLTVNVWQKIEAFKRKYDIKVK